MLGVIAADYCLSTYIIFVLQLVVILIKYNIKLQAEEFVTIYIYIYMRSEPAKPDKSTMKNLWENEKNKKHDFKEDLNDD